jgi:hypothetical protein
MADMTMFQLQEMQQQQQAYARQLKVGPPIEQMKGAVPPGSLIIADVFTPSHPQDKLSHGEMVSLAATGNGFRGPVLTISDSVDMKLAMATGNAEQGFFNPKATPEETRANVATVATNDAVGLLKDQSRMIDSATASGAKNSVLNMSSGGSVASTTAEIYWTAANAWDANVKPERRESGLTVTKNLAAAYGLSVDKLTSSDPKIAGPERARLQSSLMNGINGALETDPKVAKARTQYSTAVHRFEANRNSVVIASGNEGDVLPEMRKNAHGYEAKNVPANFATNYLAVPEATVVGATRWTKGQKGPQEHLATYSNENSGVDIHASGSLSTDGDQTADAQGTSFASPRVAATMATLHRLNPRMSSSQIEHLMSQSLTHQLDNGNGSVGVLDYQKSSDLMVGRDPH